MSINTALQSNYFRLLSVRISTYPSSEKNVFICLGVWGDKTSFDNGDKYISTINLKIDQLELSELGVTGVFPAFKTALAKCDELAKAKISILSDSTIDSNDNL